MARIKVKKAKKAWIAIDEEGTPKEDITGKIGVFVSKKLAERYGRGHAVECEIIYEFYIY